MRRLCSTIGLTMMVSTVHAVECGALVTHSRLSELQRSLNVADSALRRDEELLLAEGQGMLKRSPVTDATLNDAMRVLGEQERVSSANTSELELLLGAASTLAAIRGVMKEKWDRSVVETYLSLSVFSVKGQAEIKLKSLDRILTQTSRPGIAVNISKLRDAVGALVTEFQKCESPRLPEKK